MKKLIIVLLGLILINNTAYSKDKEKQKDRFWFNMGGGNYNSATQNAGVLYLSLNKSTNNSIFKLRLITHEEVDFAIFSPPPKEVFNSIGLLIGRIETTNRLQMQLTTGIGFNSVRRRGKATGYDSWIGPTNYSEDKFITASVLFELELSVLLSKRFGLGLVLFTEINKEIPISGVAVNFSIGQIK